MPAALPIVFPWWGSISFSIVFYSDEGLFRTTSPPSSVPEGDIHLYHTVQGVHTLLSISSLYQLLQEYQSTCEKGESPIRSAGFISLNAEVMDKSTGYYGIARQQVLSGLDLWT
jgi:hypothetical protein